MKEQRVNGATGTKKTVMMAKNHWGHRLFYMFYIVLHAQLFYMYYFV